MGNCGYKPPPDLRNICSIVPNDEYEIDNFCTGTTVISPSLREEACLAISPEWIHSRNRGLFSCYYESLNEGQEFGFGCCGVKCGQRGFKSVCKRTYFGANPTKCCFQDLVCNDTRKPKDNPACFNSGLTCPIENRDMGSNSCRELVYNYCTGVDINDQDDDNIGHDSVDFIKRWIGNELPELFKDNPLAITSPCYKAIWRNLYKDQAGQCAKIPSAGVPNIENLTWTKKLITASLDKYLSLGFKIESKNPFNSQLWDICNKYPALCQSTLKKYCARQTQQSLVRNSELISWCGCYMVPEAYNNPYGVERECTGFCNSSEVIPLPSDNEVGIKKCNKSICLIDDLTIQLYNTKIGNFGFNQICPSCQGGNCQCLISDNNITAINSNIPNLLLNQNCNSQSKCTNKDIEVPCSESSLGYLIEKQNFDIEEVNLRNRNITVGLVLLILILVIVLIWIIITKFFFLTKNIKI